MSTRNWEGEVERKQDKYGEGISGGVGGLTEGKIKRSEIEILISPDAFWRF